MIPSWLQRFVLPLVSHRLKYLLGIYFISFLYKGSTGSKSPSSDRETHIVFIFYEISPSSSFFCESKSVLAAKAISGEPSSSERARARLLSLPVSRSKYTVYTQSGASTREVDSHTDDGSISLVSHPGLRVSLGCKPINGLDDKRNR